MARTGIIILDNTTALAVARVQTPTTTETTITTTATAVSTTATSAIRVMAEALEAAVAEASAVAEAVRAVMVVEEDRNYLIFQEYETCKNHFAGFVGTHDNSGYGTGNLSGCQTG